MLFKALITLLLTSIAFAAPLLSTRAIEPCAPNLYTLSHFNLTTSPTSALVDFNFIALYPSNAGIEDPVSQLHNPYSSHTYFPQVMLGTKCHAEGTTIPNNNVCSAPNRRLLFDLRGPEETAHYQITHTWKCNGEEWMSGNDLTIGPLECHVVNGERMCSLFELNFRPQNVRKVAGGPPKV
jgi:hypothetical protein